jgi:hypothetical protein
MVMSAEGEPPSHSLRGRLDMLAVDTGAIAIVGH